MLTFGVSNKLDKAVCLYYNFLYSYSIAGFSGFVFNEHSGYRQVRYNPAVEKVANIFTVKAQSSFLYILHILFILSHWTRNYQKPSGTQNSKNGSFP